MRDLYKKFWNVSGFNFTLLPTSEIFCLEQHKFVKELFVAIETLIAYLFSSIPERLKISFLITSAHNKNENQRQK